MFVKINKKGINGVKETINYIKNNYSIALMIDQRVSEGEKVSFFGKGLTTTLPARLSLNLVWKLCLFLLKEKNDKSGLNFLNQ